MAHSPSAASSTSTSTSTSTSHNSDYDVFISHRGLDLKKTFASHLYRRLQSYGLRVFLDQPELQRGEYLVPQIEGAIGSASVHVAIFSSGYAQSTWCLKELVLMLESNSPVIPVFYNVKPEDLRWTWGKEGRYAKALEVLEKKTSTDPQTGEEKLRYDPSLIENWRNALFKAAGISGFELEACNSDEGELVDNVVEGLLKRVKKRALAVAKYPTGLDDKVTDFENTVMLPRQKSGKPQILGIAGLGGVGKTTLAKELFNRKSSDYSRSCFLSDVRDNAGKGSLNLLQRELLKSLTGWDKPIENVNEGTAILKNQISSPNILVILDDVDKVDQVDVLLPDHTVLQSDSLILITSRSKDVLKSSGVEESSIYNLTGLSTEQSLELFCLYSFNQAHPLPQFESMVEEFINACGGLPLSLKVFGALLNGEDTSYWKGQLAKLQRILPQEIKETLQISYDALDMEERQIFLDIACFFVGKDRDMAVRIWDGSGRNGLWGFRNIENRCLVEVNSENKITMHDHLRDLGREISDASLPLRFWCPSEKIDDLLRQSSVINEVRGIRMTYNSSVIPRYQSSSELFGNCLMMKLCNMRCSKQYPLLHGTRICMRNLQLLHTEDVLVHRILAKVESPNLIWLRWKKCPYSSLPSSISLKKLRVLQVRGKNLKILWKKKSQAPLQLRELEIKAPLSNIPKSIGKLTQLERLVICPYDCEGNVTLTQLPDEFCFLHSLKALSLEDFSEMKSLPECFGKLTNLRQISLSWCSALKRLPDSLGNLRNLQNMDLRYCEALESLPNSLGYLTNLLNIDLTHCKSLERLPDSLGDLTNLQNMHLGYCNALDRLPDSLGVLTNLQNMDLTSCKALERLPDSLGNLSRLHSIKLSLCFGLERLPDSFGNLTGLQHIELSKCSALERLEDSFGKLTKLQHLDLSECTKLTMSNETLGNISTLVCINLSGCEKIEILPPQLVHQVSLQKLYLKGTNLKVLSSAIGELPDLEVLEVGPLLGTPPPPSLCSLKSLKELWLYRCDELKCLPDSLGDMRKLKKLIIQYCPELKCLPSSLGDLRNLKELRIEQCVELECLPASLGQLTELTELTVSNCSVRELPFGKEEVKGKRETWSELESSIDHCILPRLQMLDLSGTGISEVSFAEGVCFNLQKLIINCCHTIVEVGTLPNRLTILSLIGCVSLVEVGTLPNTLRALRLNHCRSLKKMDKIYGLAKLHTLEISGCRELKELPGIETLISLRYLYASGCLNLKVIWGLGKLTKLELLELKGCSVLEEVEGIQHCMSLRQFNVEACPKVKLDAVVVKQLRQRVTGLRI